jgi:hypothetical protein
VDVRQLEPQLVRADPVRGMGQVRQDDERALLDHSRGAGVREQPQADLRVARGPLVLGQQRVGRLSHPVVQEAEGDLQIRGQAHAALGIEQHVVLVERQHEALLDGAPQRARGLLRRGAVHHREVPEVEHHAEAGGELQQLRRLLRQPPELFRHQGGHVAGNLPGFDLGQVPCPPAARRVEAQQVLIVQEAEELADGERVTAGARVDELAQLQRAAGVGAGGLAHHARHLLGAQRREVHLPHGRARRAQLLERDGKRVGGGDLGVAPGSHEQHVVVVRIAGERLEQRERGNVGPLQIVQEEHERPRGHGERLQRLHQHAAEAVARLRGGQARGRRLFADQLPGLGHGLDEHGGVHPQQRVQTLAGLAALRLALGQHLTDQVAHGLVDRVIGNAAQELIALAGGEAAPAGGRHPVQLIDERGLADAGRAGDEEQLRAASHGARVRGGQHLHIRDAPIQPLGQAKLVRPVRRAQREGVQRRSGLELVLALLQVGDEAPGALVAGRGVLGQQLEHDGRHRLRHRGQLLARGGRHPRHVRVEQLQRRLRLEGVVVGQQLEEGGAQGIEVRAVVHAAVHAPRLLGGHVRQGSRQRGGAVGRDGLQGDGHRDGEVGDLQHPGVGVDDDVLRLDVLVDDAVAVNVAQRPGDADGVVEERLHRQRPALVQQVPQRSAANVLEHQRHAVAELLHAEHPDDALALDAAGDGVLALNLQRAAPIQVVIAGQLQDDGQAVAWTGGPEEHGTMALVKRLLDGVSGPGWHGSGVPLHQRCCG